MAEAKHRIVIAPFAGRVRVRYSGESIAGSAHALLLRETGCADVFYIPRTDAAMEHLLPSDTVTHCPHKGDVAYFHVTHGDRVAHDAVWTYPDPLPAVRKIAGYLAFYPDKVEVETVPLG